MIKRRIARTTSIVWCAFGVLSCIPVSGQTALNYTKPNKLCELEKKEITESSGLAASNFSNDRFWTHNDSGNKARLFAFDLMGKHLGTCKLENEKQVDWEDMASAVIDGKPMLIIGDVGDNRRVRPSCTLYFVKEPQNPKNDVKIFGRLDFSYESGPVDCEAIAFDAHSRSILLTEKTRLGSFSRGRVYELPLPKHFSGSTTDAMAKVIGKTAVPTVTAMDISRDGKYMVIGSYLESMLYERIPAEKWHDALKRKGKIVHMPARRQGETICFGREKYNLYATSEKRPTPLFEIRASQLPQLKPQTPQ